MYTKDRGKKSPESCTDHLGLPLACTFSQRKSFVESLMADIRFVYKITMNDSDVSLAML